MALIGPQTRKKGLYAVRTDRESDAVDILYRLLQERTADQSISHLAMPTYEEHKAFVLRNPYRGWYLLCDGSKDHVYVGSIYISRKWEIGLFIFKKYQGQGYGTKAVKWIMSKWRGAAHYANVSPNNPASQKFFEKMGFTHVQNTLIRRNAKVTAEFISPHMSGSTNNGAYAQFGGEETVPGYRKPGRQPGYSPKSKPRVSNDIDDFSDLA